MMAKMIRTLVFSAAKNISAIRYFLLSHYSKKIDITDLNPFLAGENTSVLIILATTVCAMNSQKILLVLVSGCFLCGS